MNAAARMPSRWRRDALVGEGYSSPTGRRDPLLGDVGKIRRSRAFCVAGLGVGAFGGYFPREAGSQAQFSDSFQLRRLNAQTTSGDVQSGAGVAPYCKRSERSALELPLLLWLDRALPGPHTPAAPFSRDAAVHIVWSHCEVYRRRCITKRPRKSNGLAWMDRSRQDLPGAIALWGPASAPAAHGTAPRPCLKNQGIRRGACI